MIPDALVVGAGPVGLTMAAELARYGVSVRIIDAAAACTDKSKALVLWSRSLELIDRMGCGKTFDDAGCEVTAANIVVGRAGSAKSASTEVATPHPYALMLPQSETERLMEEHLGSYGVRVLRHPDGHEESADTAWLVGCDGAHTQCATPSAWASKATRCRVTGFSPTFT